MIRKVMAFSSRITDTPAAAAQSPRTISPVSTLRSAP
jgi:hypothetical protein